MLSHPHRKHIKKIKKNYFSTNSILMDEIKKNWYKKRFFLKKSMSI
jgi:hypothetical protein